MTSRRRLASALDKVFPHLLILLYSLGAALIYYHHWPFHQSGGTFPLGSYTISWSSTPRVAEGKTGPTAAGLSGLGSDSFSFDRRMQDIELDMV